MPGPSDLQPVVTLSRVGLVAAASWPPLPQAYRYHVEVADAGGAVVYAAEIDAATYQGTPVPLSSATFTPAAGMTYTVEVRVTGVPSAPQSFTVPTAPQLLADLRDRLISLFTRDADGRRACFGGTEKMQTDPAWKDNLIFSEYFHGDNGAAIGAFHQTGWTGLIADVILRRHGAVPALGDVLRDQAGKAQQ